MKKSFSVTIILFLSVLTSGYACEICGCGNSSFQIGLLPSFNKGFIGYRYTTSEFNSVLKTDVTQYSHDYFKTMEIWGGFNLKKFQVMAFVPYVFSRKESDDGTTISNGLGDMMLLINYHAMSSAKLTINEKTVRQDLFVGGGIKLPTGLNQVDTSNPDFNIGDFNSQAGTGSVDYLMNITHNLMWSRSGIITNAAYRINTANSETYRFGNRTYLNTSYYYTLTKGDTRIKPNAGINYQSNAINDFNGSGVEGSNGYNFNITTGLNIIMNKVGINGMVFIPIAQNMYDGQTTLKSRVLLGLTYSF